MFVFAVFILNFNFTIRLSIGFFSKASIHLGKESGDFLSMHEKNRSTDKFWSCDVTTMPIFLFLYHLGLRNWQLFSLFSKIFVLMFSF